jgi:MFS family permease
MTFMFAMSVTMLFFVPTLSPEELAASKADTARGLTTVMGPDDADLRNGRRGTLAELRSGFAYLRRDRVVLVVLAFSFLSSTLGMPIRLLLPGYVAEIFGDDGSTLGLLQMGMGLGALLGALGLASLREARHRGLYLGASAAILGIAMIAFSITDVLWVSWIGLLVVGIGSSGRMALSQVLVQEYVDDDYRGRVMALYMMQFSLMQVGAFLVSLYMELVGPRLAIQTLAIVLLAATAVFVALVPRFRALD